MDVTPQTRWDPQDAVHRDWLRAQATLHAFQVQMDASRRIYYTRAQQGQAGLALLFRAIHVLEEDRPLAARLYLAAFEQASGG